MKLIKTNNGFTPSYNSILDHFFTDDFLNWPATAKSRNNWGNLPATNIYEDENGYNVDLAVPGMKRDDFKIELKDDTLTISSQRKDEKVESKDKYTRKEFNYSSFTRSFKLPENIIDGNSISAKYEAGVLKLSIPKKEEAKPQPTRMIEIG